MRNRIRIGLAAALCAACLVTAAYAQQKNTDQVGLVFPAFVSEQDVGASVAHYLKLAVQARMRKQDPVTGKKGYGAGFTYYVPAPMARPSHDNAASLARLNGLQGTVWGNATKLVDGLSIEAYLTLSEPFSDYRQTRQEVWQTTVGDLHLQAGLPRQRVSFRPSTIPNAAIRGYASPQDVRYCPLAGGACRTFANFLITRALAPVPGGVRVSRGGKEYKVTFPKGDGISGEVIGYLTIVIAYHRGNLNQVIQQAEAFINTYAPSASMIDVHLYAAAALSRTGRHAEGREHIRQAMDLNRFAERVLRFAVMLEIDAQKYEAATAMLSAYISEHGTETAFALQASRVLDLLK